MSPTTAAAAAAAAAAADDDDDDTKVKTVLVTGGSGYLALHVVRAALAADHKVRATVRGFANSGRVTPVEQVLPSSRYPIELFETNLLSDRGWEQAMEGVDYVLHVASPFPSLGEVSDPSRLTRTSVEGTLRVLEFAKSSASVKRVVVTSSAGAVHGSAYGDENVLYDESYYVDFEDPTLSAFYRSKAMAEATAWSFSESEQMEICVVCPSLILGPALSEQVNASVDIVRLMLEGSPFLVPPIAFAICDVRDVAEALLRAMIIPDAANQRIIINSCTLWLHDIASVLSEHFGPLGYRVNRTKMPSYLKPFLGVLGGQQMNDLKPRLNKMFRFSNDRMKDVLSIHPRSVVDTIVDTGRSLVELGIVPRTQRWNELVAAQSENQQSPSTRLRSEPPAPRPSSPRSQSKVDVTIIKNEGASAVAVPAPVPSAAVSRQYREMQ